MAEHQKYEVETVYDGWEVRRYPPHLVAEVNVRGSFDEAVNRGFGSLAAFIFGENVGNHKVDMTTPVVQEPVSQKIAMTTPVLQESEGDQHVVAFVMPDKFTMETLPQPKDGSIRIREVPASLAAARRFGGRASGDTFADQLSGLLSRLHKDSDLAIVGSPRFARFDPPWKPGFLRRNEVLIPVQRVTT